MKSPVSQPIARALALTTALVASLATSGCMTPPSVLPKAAANAQSDVTRMAASADNYARQPCPALGTSSTSDAIAAEQALLGEFSNAKRLRSDAKEIYDDTLLTWQLPPASKQELAAELQLADEYAAGLVLMKAQAWEGAVVASLAADKTPLNFAALSRHPFWLGKGAYGHALQAIGKDESASKAGRFASGLGNIGNRISVCAESYRTAAIQQNANAVRSYALGLTGTSAVDRFMKEAALDGSALGSDTLVRLQADLRDHRNRLAGAEAQAAAAERDRLAAQARQAQIAENERRAAAAEAERQRQIAVAAAQAEQERMQEVWRKNFAAKRLPFNYLACSGREYVSSELGKSLTGIIGLAPTEAVTAYKFEARFEPDMKYIEISEREGPSPTREGRFRLRFVAPEKIAFDVNYTLTSPFAGGSSKSYKGEAFIDLESGNISGSINYARDPGGPARDRWDGFCSRRK